MSGIDSEPVYQKGALVHRTIRRRFVKCEADRQQPIAVRMGFNKRHEIHEHHPLSPVNRLLFALDFRIMNYGLSSTLFQ